jgi:hypothetical protein
VKKLDYSARICPQIFAARGGQGGLCSPLNAKKLYRRGAFPLCGKLTVGNSPGIDKGPGPGEKERTLSGEILVNWDCAPDLAGGNTFQRRSSRTCARDGRPRIPSKATPCIF